MVIVKYFYERTDSDYEVYDKEWDDNKHRFNFLDLARIGDDNINFDHPNGFGFMYVGNDDDISSRDILAIRFPHKQHKKLCDQLVNRIVDGKGIVIGCVTWHPKEVWIYPII